MVAAFALSVVLAFTPDASKWEGRLLHAADAPRLSVAVPGFKGVELSQAKVDFFSNHFASQLSKLGLAVTTAQDVQALISMSRQKQMLGCDDATSDKCMTEIANALGTDGIVVGSVANLSGEIAVNLKIVDAVDGRTLAIYTADAPNDKAALDMLTQAAKDMVDQLKSVRAKPRASLESGGAEEKPAAIRYERRPSNVKALGKAATYGGAVLLGGGLASLLVGRFVPLLAGIGIVALIAAPVFLVVGVPMYFLGSDEMVPVRTVAMAPEEKVPLLVAFRF